ncbi:MAG: endonuclease/exonuclease/phosphatase family protein [Pseudomonadota bacterium]
MVRASLALALCLSVLPASAFAGETQRVAAFDNATVQPAGPRPGSGGKTFFNIEGSGNGDFASFGVADFRFAACEAKMIENPRLELRQSNAGFTTDGRYSVYLTDAVDVDIQAGTSPLTYQGGDGLASVDPLLTGLEFLAEFDFVETASGSTDTVALTPSAGASAQLVAALNAGDAMRLVLVPEESAVAATYAGQNNNSGPAPTFVFEAPCSGIGPASTSLAAADNATVQSGGPRPGDSGKTFFNIQGSGNGEFAGFGVADFNLGAVPDNVTEVTGLTLSLTESNAGFTTDGLFSVFTTDATAVSIQADDSPLAYQGGEGAASVDPLLTNLAQVATAQFIEDGDGSQDVFALKFDDTDGALTDAINAGDTLRLVFAPEEPQVAATYAGQGNFDGPPPTLTIDYLTDDVGGGALDLAIYEIQGAAHRSPVTGTTVRTSGIVTAAGNFDAVGDADLRGFFLQDAAGDGDVATSDAVFVASGASVDVGDEVSVTGFVEETGFFREITYTRISASTVDVLSSANPLPAPAVIGQSGRMPPTEIIDDDDFGNIPGLGDFDPQTDGLDFFESLEAMRVTVEDAVAVSSTSRFGEIFVVTNGGNGATGISSRGTLNIAPEDFNPEKIQIDPGREFNDPAFVDLPLVDTGALLGNVTGVVGYDFGNFQVQPTEPLSVTVAAPDPDSTTLAGDATTLTVVSYNVLNLDPNDTDGDEDVANGRFDAIADQVVNALRSPDVIGVQEIQDNNGTVDNGTFSADETLQLLADRIIAAGGPAYAFIDNTFITDGTNGGAPGGNIRVAFLYNPARVSAVPDSVRTVDDTQAFAGARLPLIASFAFGSEVVTVVNNHFSSKGGSAPIFGTEQPFEALQEDSNVNGSLDSRQRQSREIQNFVNGELSGNPDARIVVLGDLNEFEFVSPVQELVDVAGLVNLTNLLAENERYTFNFQGNSQSLDHILVSEALASGASFDAVHVNSESVDSPQRASDHDPVVAAFAFGATDGLGLFPIGLTFGPGVAFDADTATFTFAPDAPGFGRLALYVVNQTDQVSGDFFIECTTTVTPGAISIRRVRGVRAGFLPDNAAFNNTGNPRVQFGSPQSPAQEPIPAGEARRLLVSFGGTGAGTDTLTCELQEQTEGGDYQQAGSVSVAVENQ